MSLKIDFRISEQTLLREADDYLRRYRGVPLLDSSDTLVPNVQSIWGSKPTQANRDSIVRAVIGDQEYNPPNSDAERMADFLDKSSMDQAVFPDIIDRKKLVPGGIPLLDIERAHRKKIDTWKIPSQDTFDYWAEKRGACTDMCNDIESMELIIGKSPSELISQCKDWVLNNIAANQGQNPTAVLPLVVKEMTMSKYDLIRMARREYQDGTFEIHTKLSVVRHHETGWFTDDEGNDIQDEWIKIPSKIVIGDGLDWILVISLDISADGKQQFCHPGPISEEFISLL